MSLTVEQRPLHVPPLEEVAVVLQDALCMNFDEVVVSVVECPDLRNKPYCLKGRGLCGSPRLGDVGGVPNLIPEVKMDKVYDIKKLAVSVDLPNAFIVGAGAGPHNFVGVNSELMANVKMGENPSNGSLISKIDAAGNYKLMDLPDSETRCALMLNMFASEGQAGKVLKIWAKKRTGDTNFVTCLRQALENHFREKPVGLGGTFRLVKGHAKCHVMPDFPSAPLTCDEDVNKWLCFFDMPAPMVFLSTLISKDPGLDLRVEHSHGYGDDCGGHYHYDTTPDTVEYEAFYNVAEFIYRVDRPKVTHDFGRN
ncbi:ester hydrolase C11orf54 homolog [Homarus americanus]|uniref:Ester hydrolase C11orf54-like n=1 Tax=Homarus americanus TaxID=6706 RepID=A0A8J5J8N2_HOMAM|nr:ester hydrolase C11orf54 homolog [Homarus americanus]KAG7154592.1 Ester hydrolase C11orf54-like [Homarus americanus]